MTDVKKPEDPKAPAAAHPDRPVESASAAPGEKRSASRAPLMKASESGDPAVHQALAELNAAQMNAQTHKDAAEASAEAAKGHDEAVQKAKDALADLGYE